jgi:hypothetical protein
VIHKLERQGNDKVRPLFAELEKHHLVIGSIFAGKRSGAVYVDDKEKPQSAFLYSHHWYFLAGKADNEEFNRSLTELIMGKDFQNDHLRSSPSEISLVCHPDDWREQFHNIFDERPLIEVPRRSYVFKQAPFDWKDKFQDGFGAWDINLDLLENKQIKNTEILDFWLKYHWGASVETFYQQGIGVCLIHNDEIASWCMTSSLNGESCELTVEAESNYRKQGLDIITALAAVERCLRKGFTTINWHTDDSNITDWQSAEITGFVKVYEYDTFLYFFDPIDHFAVAGTHLIRSKRYQEAAEWYSHALIDTAPEWVFYMAARAQAGMGEHKVAFEYLNRAIDKGMDNVNYLNNCQEFDGLHKKNQWKKLLKRLQKGKS